MKQIISDGMLLILVPSPLLIGIIVKVGLPFINKLTIDQLNFSIKSWYQVADALLISLTPFLIAIVSAFILLDERDEGTGIYYEITPVQGYSYIIARIGLPMLWALLCSVIIGKIFNISGLSLLELLSTGLIGVGFGTSCSMMIVALAKNRVEGLAISKLAGVSLLGILAGTISGFHKYIAGILPSFWIGEILRDEINIFNFSGGVLVSTLWIFIFLKRFLKRI